MTMTTIFDEIGSDAAEERFYRASLRVAFPLAPRRRRSRRLPWSVLRFIFLALIMIFQEIFPRGFPPTFFAAGFRDDGPPCDSLTLRYCACCRLLRTASQPRFGA